MGLLLISLLSACSGGSSDVATPTGPVCAVPEALVAQTWQARLAVDAARAPFEGRTAWVEVFNARWATALPAFASENDPAGLARMHASYAAVYRQAALMAANATVQVYRKDAQPTDPAEVAYLVGIAGAMIGDADARGQLGAVGTSTVKGAFGVLAERDAAWKKWADGGAAWPPPVELPIAQPALTDAGGLPDAGAIPHWALPERDAAGLLVDAGDPSAMWALAAWHEARARAADTASGALVDVLIDPWRLPVERVVGAPGLDPAAEGSAAPVGVTVPDAYLFLSPVSSAEDLLFLADLAKKGAPAIAEHAPKSAFAAIAQSCTVTPAQAAPAGAAGNAAAMNVDCVLDQAAAFGSVLEDAMAKAAGGQPADFHRAFADLARVGVLRAADRAALALGDADASGRLRINALDRSTGAARDPLFLLSVAAWDAGNRNSVRAQELVHGQLTHVPGLEAARLPLDALHIRLSRNAGPSRPMH